MENNQECDNCHRKQFNCNTQHPYVIRYHVVDYSDIRKRGKFKFIKKRPGRQSSERNVLCQECFEYCIEKKDPTKCAWPAFLWNLLSGCQKSKFNREKRMI